MVQEHVLNESQQHPIAYSQTGENLGRKSLGFARPLAWFALLLVVGLALALSTYIGNAARHVLLSKQRNFASLLAENLNHQIYRRFTLPTLIGFGNIALRQTAQYERLDQVVQSTIHGLHVEELRIYGYDYTITYASNKEGLGEIPKDTSALEKAGAGDSALFFIDASMSNLKAFFSFPLAEKTFMLRTLYPLRIENRLPSSSESGPIMGVLEFSQDITRDMESAFRFQQLVMVLVVCTSSLLFMLVLFFIRRAERASAQLYQNERLVAMGRMVASIAHEIRNPLGIIRSSAELLLKKTNEKDVLQSRMLNAIYDESKRLSQTVSDFLDFARPRQPRNDPVDLTATLHQCLVFLEPEILAKNISIVRQGIIDAPVYTTGDKELLYRALYNIISNSVQAIGTEGVLTIACTTPPAMPAQVQLVIQDTGPGFPPEHINSLLEPFFTTKDHGTGLGLPIVNSIITSHKGSITLDNTSDGARISITLPLHTLPTD